MKLSSSQEALLLDIASGGTLKAQRDLEGNKRYWLRKLTGDRYDAEASDVDLLKNTHLIDSNMKFPAATYLLTDKGNKLVEELTGDRPSLLFTRNYSPKI